MSNQQPGGKAKNLCSFLYFYNVLLACISVQIPYNRASFFVWVLAPGEIKKLTTVMKISV